MRDKGVADYVEPLAWCRDHVPDARFRLLGKSEPDNPTGLSAETVKRWVQRGLVEHLPECTDVRPHLADAHVFVLPSFYREGLPRTLLEALATGRPVITTDMPGCREPVIPGENGWLVPCRQPRALADAMLQSIASRAKLERMGRRSREIAEERFDVVKVNHQMLRSMRIEPSSGNCSARRQASCSGHGMSVPRTSRISRCCAFGCCPCCCLSLLVSAFSVADPFPTARTGWRAASNDKFVA